MTITIADGRGALWQWDTGRRLRVGSGVEQIHYQNRALGGSVDVDVGTDGTAIIPDELLQDCHTLTAYAYVTDDTGAYTMVQQDFIVHKRAKPAGYTYTPTDQMTLRTIQRQIGDLADLTLEAKDTLVAAINEAERTGGAGSMDFRVVDGYIQYSTDGGSTWTNLIAVADLKGADGKPGAAGADGVTPTIGPNGNWFLGATDTGKPSRGETGTPGKDGAKGAPGAPGAAGHTPVKGTDYWTAADKQEIIDDTKNAIDLSSYAKLSNLAPLAGTTTELTPAQVHQAILAGTPVVVKYTDSAYGELSFTSFNVANEFGRIVSQTIVYYGGNYILAELVGDLNGKWDFDSATLAEKKDIPTVPSSLKNPNALTIKIGSTTVTYDGSAAQTVTIDDGTEVSY